MTQLSSPRVALGAGTFSFVSWPKPLVLTNDFRFAETKYWHSRYILTAHIIVNLKNTSNSNEIWTILAGSWRLIGLYLKH